MELQSVFELLQSIPFFIWIILAVVIVFLFGDKQLWEYEAKFPYQAGVGRGEIEIEYYNKAKGSIDVELDLEEPYINQHIEIYLANQKILDIPASSANTPHVRIHDVYHHSEPHEGMNIDVRCKGKVIFSGKMIMD